LRLAVEDDGPGFEPEFELAARAGVGFKNTTSRLEQLYTGRATFRIENRSPSGARIEITLPLSTSVAIEAAAR
jgi:signal transduction histidine kinase